ncbi:MAG: hypothetical protein Q7S24_02175, partial [bacterium]|nr:hypothetical protein [bacterium]
MYKKLFSLLLTAVFASIPWGVLAESNVTSTDADGGITTTTPIIFEVNTTTFSGMPEITELNIGEAVQN